jgi:hypothetical protein
VSRKTGAGSSTAEAEARLELGADLVQTASRLARIVGAVKHPAALASARMNFAGQFLVNAQQQSKKIGILQEGMAHFVGLFSWQKRDSPKGRVCSSSPRGTPLSPSRCLTKTAPITIKIGDRTQEQLLDQGARHSLEMRRPHFKRQFALLLVA